MSGVTRVEDAHVLYGELKDMIGGPHATGVTGLLSDCWRDRGFGDFWAHMLVASGAAEVMLDPELNLWDFAAVQVVVEEAGGRLTDLDGGAGIYGSAQRSRSPALPSFDEGGVYVSLELDATPTPTPTPAARP